MGDSWVPIVIGVGLLCGLLGGAIGSPKGLGSTGFWLGLILGVIGVIIVALMRPEEPDPRTVRAVGSIGAPGWWPDPYGAHQHRYFDGYVWTAHVSDQGIQAQDPR